MNALTCKARLLEMPLLRYAVLLVVLCAASVTAADSPRTAPSSDSHILFSAPLADVPGKRLVVVRLELDPRSKVPFTPHRHPGSVYVYVTEGAVRWALNGQPAQIAHAGEGFFEPPEALHSVNESAAPGARAAAIAVLIVPEGAPLLTVDTAARSTR